tara:strand:+ start:8099 stop:8992 length:894 start_codon:yes stop_codon:yes gene_type:complete
MAHLASTLDNEKIKTAENAVMAIVDRYNLPVQKAQLIGGYSNTLFKLAPLPLVARVATATASVRKDSEWMRRELAVANYLNQVQASVVRPSQILPPGPHQHEGLTVTFWEYFEHTDAPPPPFKTGELLHDLHDGLTECSVTLPVMGPLQEAWKILDDPVLTHSLQGDARAVVNRASDLVQHRLDEQELEIRPLHGDAHHGNLWQTPNGPIWGDFEDACTGPIEWDLACLVASSCVFGTGRAASEAIEGYAGGFDPILLDLLIMARTIQAVAWAFVSLAEPTSSHRLQQRLDWLARRS